MTGGFLDHYWPQGEEKNMTADWSEDTAVDQQPTSVITIPVDDLPEDQANRVQALQRAGALLDPYQQDITAIDLITLAEWIMTGTHKP